MDTVLVLITARSLTGNLTKETTEVLNTDKVAVIDLKRLTVALEAMDIVLDMALPIEVVEVDITDRNLPIKRAIDTVEVLVTVNSFK
jgi:hypothetical protein